MSKLAKPAQIGNTIFGAGVDEQMVIERAQREHEYRQRPEFEAVRINQSHRLLRLFHIEGVLAELVELKGMKEALDNHDYHHIILDDVTDIRKSYTERKDRAWARARELLQGFRDGADAEIPF